MKKIAYLILSLPLLLVSACSDEREIPDASISASFSGVYVVPDENELYAVSGDTIVVEDVTVKSQSGENVAIGPVDFIWNGFDIGTIPVAPFRYEITTSSLPNKYNMLTLRTNLLIVDHPIYTALVQYKIKIVPDKDSLPDGATLFQSPGNNVLSETRIKE